MKTPLAIEDAEAAGVPFSLWARPAFGDLLIWAADAVIAFIPASVVVVIYWAPAKHFQTR